MLNQSKLKQSGFAFQIVEPCPTDNSGMLNIQNIQLLSQFPVFFRFKTKFWDFAPFTQNFVAAFIRSDRSILRRNIWNLEHNFFKLFFNMTNPLLKNFEKEFEEIMLQ